MNFSNPTSMTRTEAFRELAKIGKPVVPDVLDGHSRRTLFSRAQGLSYWFSP
jgi:hypothetical protein